MKWFGELFKKQKIQEVMDIEEKEKEDVILETLDISVNGFTKLSVEENENAYSWTYKNYINLEYNLKSEISIDSVIHTIKSKGNIHMSHGRFKEEALNKFFELSEEERNDSIMENLKDVVVRDARSHFYNMKIEAKEELLKKIGKIDISFTFKADKSKILKS